MSDGRGTAAVIQFTGSPPLPQEKSITQEAWLHNTNLLKTWLRSTDRTLLFRPRSAVSSDTPAGSEKGYGGETRKLGVTTPKIVLLVES
ncbi:hypothetical protein SKAU_G00362950 [Synaphobranchus kaupii]|uniref:Uncharacterized protein n=1 Tax=Synaphobranchus kaupii TaxID=118154 RepID=A0A9Q1IHA9_SYNKA|nr:hypothetical protein SKAU_G00362950 [Synaphobranchus kaupii]